VGAQANIHVHLVSDSGDVRTGDFTVAGSSRRTVKLSDLMPDKALSVSATSNVPVVVERVQLFGSLGQGVTTTIGVQAGSLSQYIDSGHLPTGAQGHLAIYNPGATAAAVSVTPIDQHGKAKAPIKLTIKAGRRGTNRSDGVVPHCQSRFAEITSTVPVVAEKVAYYGRFTQSVGRRKRSGRALDSGVTGRVPRWNDGERRQRLPQPLQPKRRG